MSITPQAIQIRPFETANQAAIDQLMQHCWPDDPDTIAYYRVGAQSELTLCAWHQEQLIGLGSLWNNRVHQQHCYFGLHVHPDYQQAGIDQLLYVKLIAQTTIIKQRMLQTAIWSHAQTTLDFLTTHGFQVIKHTYLGEFSLLGLEIPSLPQSESPPNNVQFYSFHEYLSSYPLEPLLSLINSCYQATHGYNLADQAALELQTSFLSDIHETTAFVLCDHDQIVGFNCIYHSAAVRTLEQGLIGVANAYNQQQAWIIRSLFQNTLRLAQQNKYQRLRYEIDSIDPWAMELLSFLPIMTQPSWMTLCSVASLD